MFAITYTRHALADIRALDARWQARILDEVDRHLQRDPTTPSSSRKLIDLAPPSDLEGAIQPFWQLRVDHFRVFYNVDEKRSEVCVWGVRAKPPELTTGEVLEEKRKRKKRRR